MFKYIDTMQGFLSSLLVYTVNYSKPKTKGGEQ